MPFYRATRHVTLELSGGLTQGMEAGTTVELRDLADQERFPNFRELVRNGSLVAEPSLDAIGRNSEPLPSDWTDIRELLEDMHRYAREHPEATFLCADDPGQHGRRIPRFGWVAYESDRGIESNVQQWTITIGNLRDTRRRLPVEVERALETAAGRQQMLVVMMARARAQTSPPPMPTPPTPPTLWDRLLSDD